MKKFLLVICFGILLVSCKNTYVTRSSAIEDASYVMVVSSGDVLKNIVTVEIDGDSYPLQRVEKIKKEKNAEKIKIAPGKHNIKVYKGSELVSQQNAFLGSQETRKIVIK
jgi:hypothetical protein